eukprot:220693_1
MSPIIQMKLINKYSLYSFLFKFSLFGRISSSIMQTSLLQSEQEQKDVTNPQQVTIFKKHENARKRINTTERFKMNHDELNNIMLENAKNIERRNAFIKNNIKINSNETQQARLSDVDLNKDPSNSFYGFSMPITPNAMSNKNRIPIQLSWRNITYKVMTQPPKTKGIGRGGLCAKKQKRVILNNISGDMENGKLVAILGPSGSGKTTLLNVISKRLIKQSDSVLDGSIIINGVDRYELGKSFTNVTGFVQQDDLLFNQQTVYETFMTAARFSNTVHTKEDRHELVESVLKELDLTHIRDTKIGDAEVRGVSGGERKRVNIGTQMIRNPSLLFLDEPTSGLDSYQALKVVETLKKLCENGCTVMTSIHQPRSSIFTLFDDIILLSSGRLIYHGPSGDHALKYFAEKTYVCPPYFNPADFFLDLVSVDTRSVSAESKSRARIDFLINEFAKETQYKSIPVMTDDNTQLLDRSKISNKISVCEQLITLSQRTFRQMLRDKRSFIIRILMNIIFAGFISGVYCQNRGKKDQESIFNREGVLFFMCILQSMGPIINTVQGFCLEKCIVMRERQTRSYSLGMYYINTFISSMPIQIIFPVVFGAILYWIVGLNPSPTRFLWFLLITILQNFSSIGLGFLCGCAAPSVEAATTIAQTLVALMILFSGFFIHTDSLPLCLRWLTNISTIRWSFMAFMINEFEGQTDFKCNNPNIVRCRTEGIHVLKEFGYDDWTKQQSIAIIAILLACFHLLAFIMLKINRIKYMDVSKQAKQEVEMPSINK